MAWSQRGKNDHWGKGKGATAQYRRDRAASLRAHLAKGGGCELRISANCTGKAEEWHHTRDRRVYGDNPEYMVWSCSTCNNKAGDPTRSDPPPRPSTQWS